jgi:hypothetical protein
MILKEDGSTLLTETGNNLVKEDYVPTGGGIMKVGRRMALGLLTLPLTLSGLYLPKRFWFMGEK